jgi:hypothetical protein
MRKWSDLVPPLHSVLYLLSKQMHAGSALLLSRFSSPRFCFMRFQHLKGVGAKGPEKGLHEIASAFRIRKVPTAFFSRYCIALSKASSNSSNSQALQF